MDARLGGASCLAENPIALRGQRSVDNQVTPRLGGAQMQKIKPVHLTEFYSVLMREGAVSGKPLAAQTVHHVHRLLHRAFGHAVTWEVIRDNPVARASPPKVAPTEIEIPTESEIAALLERLAKRNRQLHALAIVALATGARRGELCALTWKSFDAKAGTLQVGRSLEDTEEGLRTKRAQKTKHGRRTIRPPGLLVEDAARRIGSTQGKRRVLGLGSPRPRPGRSDLSPCADELTARARRRSAAQLDEQHPRRDRPADQSPQSAAITTRRA